jgi:hypothetical protein
MTAESCCGRLLGAHDGEPYFLHFFRVTVFTQPRSFASIPSRPSYVRFALDSDHSAVMPGRQLRARSCREQAQQERQGAQKLSYSISSSARASSVAGTLRPIDLAVLRLIISSNLVGCSTGMFTGFSPRKILSTNTAACRYSTGPSAA